jgi:hypothetical protein
MKHAVRQPLVVCECEPVPFPVPGWIERFEEAINVWPELLPDLVASCVAGFDPMANRLILVTSQRSLKTAYKDAADSADALACSSSFR